MHDNCICILITYIRETNSLCGNFLAIFFCFLRTFNPFFFAAAIAMMTPVNVNVDGAQQGGVSPFNFITCMKWGQCLDVITVESSCNALLFMKFDCRYVCWVVESRFKCEISVRTHFLTDVYVYQSCLDVIWRALLHLGSTV